MKPPQGRPTSIGTHYLRYSTSSALVTLAGLVSFPLLTRLLDNTQFGILKYYDSWLMIGVALVKLGSQHAIVRFYPYDRDPVRLRAFGTNYVLLPLALSSIAWALAAAGMTAWHWWLGVAIPPVLWCAVLVTPVMGATAIIQMVVRASERSDLVIATRIGGRYLELVVVLLAVVFLQRSALAVYGGKLLAGIIVMAWLLRWLRRNIPFARDMVDLAQLRQSLVYGLPLMAHEMASVVLSAIDRVMLKSITGDFAIVGIYAIGYALASQLNVFLDTTLFESFTPVANRTYESGGASAVQELKARVLMPVTYLAVAIVAMLLVCGQDVLVALSGPGKEGSGGVFVVIGISLAVFALFSVINYGLLLMRWSMLLLGTTLLAALLNIALNLVLIPRMGYMGAAWASAISYAVLMATRYIACPKNLLRLPDTHTLLVSVGCATALVLVARGSDLFGVDGPWLRLAVSGLLFMGLYVAPVLALDPRFRQMLSSLREARR